MANRITEFIKRHGMRLGVIALVSALGAGTYLLTKNDTNGKKAVEKDLSQSLQEAQNEIVKSTPKPTFNYINVMEETPQESENLFEETAMETPQVTEAPVKTRRNSQKLAIPVKNGKLTRAFSGDDFVYFSSLDSWMTHNGVDITASAGDSVCSVLAGTVKAIEVDSSGVYTVSIEHSDGFMSIYRGLAEVSVKVDDKVGKDAEIGKLGTPDFEAVNGAHLHFEYVKDGKYLDPAEFFEK